MTDERTQIRIAVSKAHVSIVAPLDVTEADLLDAARAAHRKARRRLEPNRDQRASALGFRAQAARASGATWREVTEDLATLTSRDDLDERQVRRWAKRWDDVALRLTHAANAELRRAAADTRD